MNHSENKTKCSTVEKRILETNQWPQQSKRSRGSCQHPGSEETDAERMEENDTVREQRVDESARDVSNIVY